MRFQLLGGVLLIVGTSIGGGMLALPIVMAEGGFLWSVILLLASWTVMTFSAFLILEVNLWMPTNSNMILMAKRTLGPWGAIVGWVCYLLLFYCLLAAYIAGGSDVFHDLVHAAGLSTKPSLDAILFALILGFVVYLGIESIDYVNRGLMTVKLLALFLLVIFIFPQIAAERLMTGQLHYLIPAITVVTTSFGFANIVPSLRSYFRGDVKKLRRVILIGSLVPLVCYILWVCVVFGGVPLEGEHGLLQVVHAEHSTLALNQALIHHLNNSWITSLTRIFTSVCVITSFLGVSLCVVDFLADGFNLEKTGLKKLLLHMLTLLPPLIIALLYPTAFILGLSYGGIFVSILMMLLPALMTWSGRYHKKIAADYRVIGGKLPLVIVMVVSVIVILQGIFLTHS